ncbi:MAG: hypothetical protein K8R90_06110 [Candidatus Cloacimonetes bacterium]|nr:hypothetical protein [Candidatus Cloacimonadota bacterium]
MSLEERLEQALNERDMISVKSHLTSFIDKYPLNENNAVVEAFEIARSRCPKVVQRHEGEQLLQNRSVWDNNYLALLMDDLIDNFSPERFHHAMEVSGYIHRRKHPLVESGDELQTLPQRRADLTLWLVLTVAMILFLVVMVFIRSAL